MIIRTLLRPFIVLLLLSFVLAVPGQVSVDLVRGRVDPSANRTRGVRMLKEVKSALTENYYDKKFHGLDIEKEFDEAEKKIKTLDTNSAIFRVIANVIMKLNDSHTRFIPPGRADRVEYGFALQIIGERCFVVDVTHGSDAEKQGVKAGDEVAKIGQWAVTRSSLWVLNYYIYQLEPQPVIRVTFRDAKGVESVKDIASKVKTFEQRKKEAFSRKKEERDNPVKCQSVTDQITACKLRTFVVEKKSIDEMMKAAANSPKLIIDLRGNRGGYVKIEEYLASHFFDREVKIADIVTRTKREERIAKPVKSRQFKGELVVLIDSNSASASEVFSRLMQIEKRGRIIGDISAGAVMTSWGLGLQIDRGVDSFLTITTFGLNVSIADLIMSDGQRLENVGVMPDKRIGPSPYALANKTDPILAYAAETLGAKMSPEEAGKFEFLFKQDEAAADDDDDEKGGD